MATQQENMYDKMFVSGQFCICRRDFMGKENPMVVEELPDELMQKIVDDIQSIMQSMYTADELCTLSDFVNGKQIDCSKQNLIERMIKQEYNLHMTCAVKNGMRYWEHVPKNEKMALKNKIATGEDVTRDINQYATIGYITFDTDDIAIEDLPYLPNECVFYIGNKDPQDIDFADLLSDIYGFLVVSYCIISTKTNA